MLNTDANQLFVADDAFGRTEYDPSMGLQWEKELVSILGALDRRHWLIWTSRKHILKRALGDLDFQAGTKFPKPSEVLVDASELTVREKSLMLYRHTRASTTDAKLLDIVKTSASLIVQHDSFTPERIRRFVTEGLAVRGKSGSPDIKVGRS